MIEVGNIVKNLIPTESVKIIKVQPLGTSYSFSYVGINTNQSGSKVLGMDETTVSKWCTNTSQSDLGSLMKMVQLLNVELTELVRFEEFKKNGTKEV